MFRHVVKIKKLDNAQDLPLINYAHPGDAGLDLYANIDEVGIGIPPFGRVIIPCGFKIELPKGFEAQIRPRSGLAAKNGITVLNSPGTIDNYFKGEVGVILINLDDRMTFYVHRGDRIAQMVIKKVPVFKIKEVNKLSVTGSRGEGGFGSTGRR
jgi:dUTP pyrophosphatase